MANEGLEETKSSFDFMSVDIDQYLTEENLNKIKKAIRQIQWHSQTVFERVTLEDELQALRKQVTYLEGKIKSQESQIKVLEENRNPYELDTDTSDRISVRDSTLMESESYPNRDDIEDRSDNEFYQGAASIEDELNSEAAEGPPSFTPSTNGVIEIEGEPGIEIAQDDSQRTVTLRKDYQRNVEWKPGQLIIVQHQINQFLQHYSESKRYVHDISVWGQKATTRELYCFEVNKEKYRDGRNKEFQNFVLNSNDSVVQYTITEEHCSGMRNKKKEGKILLRKMIFMQYTQFWDSNYIASPLCQNNRCFRVDHLVLEKKTARDYRTNCWGGPCCQHTPRCLVPGKNPRGEPQPRSEPAQQSSESSYYITPGGFRDFEEKKQETTETSKTDETSAPTIETLQQANNDLDQNEKILRKRYRNDGNTQSEDDETDV